MSKSSLSTLGTSLYRLEPLGPPPPKGDTLQ